jgi:hypothetical protein
MTAEAQLDAFLAKYTPEIAAHARAILRAMKVLVPGACWLVYDNYNALVIAFSASERPAGIVLSVALYPRWVSVFFVHGEQLPDPQGLLRGAGGIRHVRIDDLAVVRSAAMKRLVKSALKDAAPKIDPRRAHLLVIQSVSKKQRPRRPA